jgi:hypothetical protein
MRKPARRASILVILHLDRQKTRQDKTRQDKTRQDKTRQDKATKQAQVAKIINYTCETYMRMPNAKRTCDKMNCEILRMTTYCN